MTAWEVPDEAYFTHPDLPHRRLQKQWNNEAWGSVTAVNEGFQLLLLKGDMPAILIAQQAGDGAEE